MCGGGGHGVVSKWDKVLTRHLGWQRHSTSSEMWAAQIIYICFGLAVQTGSEQFSHCPTLPELEPEPSVQFRLCKLNHGSVQVQFRFELISEPNFGSTTTHAHPTAVPPSTLLLHTQLEYVDRVVCRTRGEQCGHSIESDGVDPHLARAAADLVKLLHAGDRPDSDHHALL